MKVLLVVLSVVNSVTGLESQMEEDQIRKTSTVNEDEKPLGPFTRFSYLEQISPPGLDACSCYSWISVCEFERLWFFRYQQSRMLINTL